jgi:hypothetical protein
LLPSTAGVAETSPALVKIHFGCSDPTVVGVILISEVW